MIKICTISWFDNKWNHAKDTTINSTFLWRKDDIYDKKKGEIKGSDATAFVIILDF